jgi:hypothetical protein
MKERPACEDSTFPRYSFAEHLAKVNIAANVTIYSQTMHPYAKPWERYAVGYKTESSAMAALGLGQHITIYESENRASLTEKFTESIRQSQPDSSTGRKLSWIEVNGFEDQSIEQIDRCLGEIFDAFPSNSILISLTQADLRPAKILSAKKQISKWDTRIMAEALSKGSAYDASTWTEDDERAMIIATAQAICGAMFIRYKS